MLSGGSSQTRASNARTQAKADAPSGSCTSGWCLGISESYFSPIKKPLKSERVEMELDATIPDKRTPSSNLPDLNGLVSGLIVIYLLRRLSTVGARGVYQNRSYWVDFASSRLRMASLKYDSLSSAPMNLRPAFRLM